MIQQRNNLLWYKLNGSLRWLHVHHGCRLFDHLIVNEFPKSGGSWVAQMLSDTMSVSFPRNRLPHLKRSVLHGHYKHSSNMKNVTVVWRDGRDVMVSWYFHRVVGNEFSNKDVTSRLRKELDIRDESDISLYLPRFIEHCMSNPRKPAFSWPQFVDDWIERDCVHVKYEDLHQNAIGTLRRIAEANGTDTSELDISAVVEKYSFESQSMRKVGVENTSSYLRKGIVGDWKTKYSNEAIEVFEYYGKSALQRLGYMV